ncbi:DUF4177 domain-containing protein [Sporosarcina sp. FSL W7-1283]|uniref:DUF4177 domain-containing protein n=1 Tax=Sporosarcina sp. FSL W7-1283 TaxID=2921560 RepID=UPI0030F55F02
MKTIEYQAVYFSKLTKPHYQELDMHKLNELGEEGWELVSIVSGQCIFKRAVTAQLDETKR